MRLWQVKSLLYAATHHFKGYANSFAFEGLPNPVCCTGEERKERLPRAIENGNELHLPIRARGLSISAYIHPCLNA